MSDITAILQSLGFLDSEVRTYLASLEYGPGTVLDLTKKTHLSRQATYVVIEALTRRGLMSSVIRGKKKYFIAEDPEKLLFYARRRGADMVEKIKDLERILPDIKLKVGGEKPVVKLFEGKDGLMSIISDIETTKTKEVLEFCDVDAFRAVVRVEDARSIVGKLKKVGTTIRSIYAMSDANLPKIVEGEWYVLPKELGGFKSNIVVYGYKVALISLEGKMHSVIIESEALSNTFRIIFKLLFSSAKEFEKR